MGYSEIAMKIAKKYLIEKQNYTKSEIDHLNIVWFCKTLQNWKCLVACSYRIDYLEITYDGNKNVAYVDFYVKENNELIKTW